MSNLKNGKFGLISEIYLGYVASSDAINKSCRGGENTQKAALINSKSCPPSACLLFIQQALNQHTFN